ncbi:MAG TPA: AAA family ATPase, partial [Euzebya sp.]|nr:AAA family ATPase [Euzebya sp.]
MAACVFGLSNAQARVYTAEARVFFVDPRGAGVLGGGGQPRVDTVAFVNQQVQQATSRHVLERATELVAGERPSVDQLSRAVTVDAQPELLAMEVRATAASPDAAAMFANAVVDSFDAVIRERGLAQAERAVAELSEEVATIQTQIDELEQQLTATPDQPVLNARLQSLVQVQLDLEARQRELTVEAVATGAGIDLIEAATPPLEPAGPKPVRDAILVGLLSLLVAGGAAHWHATRARKVDHRLDAEQVLDVPLLGEMPRFDATAVDAGDVEPAVSEALQFALSSMAFVIGDADATSIAITSATPGEGKTSLSLLLARAMGAEDRPVVLVDADLRARGLTRGLGDEGRRGLTDFVDLGVAMDRCTYRPTSRALEAITVMPAGRNDDAPTGMLRSQTFSRRLDELKQSFDVVILDTPPLLAVADAAVVCAQADAVVLIVDHGIRIADLHRLRERLAIVPRPIVGYIYNRAPLRGSHYGYGYGA